MSRRWAGAAIIAVVAGALVGCGGGAQVDPSLTKEDAKAIAQAGEDEIVALIPDELVDSVDQHPTGALLSCQGDHDYVWAGGTDVMLSGGDVGEIIDGILALGEQDGWRAERQVAAAGDPRAVLHGPDGDSYVVDGLADRMQIGISSASPCFHLPDDESPESF